MVVTVMLLLAWVEGVCAAPLLTPGVWFLVRVHGGTPIAQELHHFFFAIARTSVNNDELGGTSLQPVVWSNAANPERRSVDRAVRNLAWQPASLWASDLGSCACGWCLAIFCG